MRSLFFYSFYYYYVSLKKKKMFSLKQRKLKILFLYLYYSYILSSINKFSNIFNMLTIFNLLKVNSRIFNFNFGLYLPIFFSNILQEKNKVSKFLNLQKTFMILNATKKHKSLHLNIFLELLFKFQKEYSFRNVLLLNTNFNTHFFLDNHFFLQIFSKLIRIFQRKGLKFKAIRLLNKYLLSQKYGNYYVIFFNLLTYLLVFNIPFNFFPKRFGKIYILIPNVLKSWAYFFNSFQFLHTQFITSFDDSLTQIFTQNNVISQKFSSYIDLFERGFDRMGQLRIKKRRRRLNFYDLKAKRGKGTIFKKVRQRLDLSFMQKQIAREYIFKDNKAFKNKAFNKRAFRSRFFKNQALTNRAFKNKTFNRASRQRRAALYERYGR